MVNELKSAVGFFCVFKSNENDRKPTALHVISLIESETMVFSDK